MIQQVKHLQQVFNNNSPHGFVDRITLHESCYYQIEEECKEFSRDILPALMKCDGSAEKETRDWIVDMTVYLLQYAYRVGVIDQISEDFYKIYLNNTTKVCEDSESADETVDQYTSQGIECYSERNDFGQWVVKRVEDGKVLKPIGYQAVEL